MIIALVSLGSVLHSFIILLRAKRKHHFTQLGQNQHFNVKYNLKCTLMAPCRHNMTDPENPVELAFQPKYGELVKYQWFGDGYVVVTYFFFCFVRMDASYFYCLYAGT